MTSWRLKLSCGHTIAVGKEGTDPPPIGARCPCMHHGDKLAFVTVVRAYPEAKA